MVKKNDTHALHPAHVNGIAGVVEDLGAEPDLNRFLGTEAQFKGAAVFVVAYCPDAGRGEIALQGLVIHRGFLSGLFGIRSGHSYNLQSALPFPWRMLQRRPCRRSVLSSHGPVRR